MEQHDTRPTGAGPWTWVLHSPLILALGTLLLVQLAAAPLLGWGDRGTLAPAAANTALLEFDPKTVTRLRIEGSGETVTLTRADASGNGDWSVAELEGFPAEPAKVEALLERLAGLKRPLPTATSPEALERHKVGDTGFERKVTLESSGQPVATLILGDSPGFKRQFARPAGETAVFDLDLPLFEVSSRPDDWLVRDRLHLDQEQILGIAAADWRLTKGKEGWQLAGVEAKPDPAIVINLIARLSNLGYRGVLGKADKPEYDQANPVLQLRIQLADGGTREYRISKLKDGKDYVLKSADHPWYFKLSDFDLEALLGLDRDKLLGKAPAPADQAAGSDSAPKEPNAPIPTAAPAGTAPAEQPATQPEGLPVQ